MKQDKSVEKGIEEIDTYWEQQIKILGFPIPREECLTGIYEYCRDKIIQITAKAKEEEVTKYFKDLYLKDKKQIKQLQNNVGSLQKDVNRIREVATRFKMALEKRKKQAKIDDEWNKKQKEQIKQLQKEKEQLRRCLHSKFGTTNCYMNMTRFKFPKPEEE